MWKTRKVRELEKKIAGLNLTVEYQTERAKDLLRDRNLDRQGWKDREMALMVLYTDLPRACDSDGWYDTPHVDWVEVQKRADAITRARQARADAQVLNAFETDNPAPF